MLKEKTEWAEHELEDKEHLLELAPDGEIDERYEKATLERLPSRWDGAFLCGVLTYTPYN